MNCTPDQKFLISSTLKVTSHKADKLPADYDLWNVYGIQELFK